MERIPYERMAQLVAISAVKKNVESMKSALPILTISKRRMTVAFSDYVKSQLHLNTITEIFSRDLSDYAKTLHFLQGDAKYVDEACKVLRYFYTDLAGFLINNLEDIQLSVVVDADFGEDLPEEFVDVIAVRSQLLDLVSDDCSEEELITKLSSCKYSAILDSAENDVVEKQNSYALAAILSDLAKQDQLKILRMEDNYESNV